jgi:hypothetical protein
MENENNETVTNADLGRAFAGSILKMMAIKWTVIIVANKLAKRYVEKHTVC